MVEPSPELPDAELAIRGGAGRRASLVTIDQVISGGSNLMLVVIAAHMLSAADFGRFSLVFFAWAFTQGAVVRSLVASTVVVHPEDADERPRAVLGAAVLLSLASGLLCAIAGAASWWAGSDVGLPLVLVGLLMPLLGVQDAGRYMAVAESKPGRAIVLDSIWLGLILAALAAVAVAYDVTLMWLVAVWAGTGAVAGLWVFVQHGIPRARELSLDWLRLRWHFSWRSLVAASSTSAFALIGSSLLAIVSGPLAVAAVRAALLLERPSTTVQTAVATSAATDIAREKSDNAGMMRHQRRALLAGIAVAVVNFAVLMVIPDSVGELVLGNVWVLVEPLLFVIGVHICTLAAQSGVRAALIGRRQIQPVMLVDIVGTLLAIVGLVIGAVQADALGAMWGAVIGQAITAVIWWIALARHLAKWPEGTDPVAGTGSDDVPPLPPAA
jgi:O-antigen/teichoic acid export membrane protein